MFSLQLTDLKEAQSHNGLSPGYKSNLVIKWQNIWHLHGIPSGLYEAKLKSMDFDMLFNANFTNLTNFSWICNQKWNIFKWSRYLTKDTFMLKSTMWSIPALSFLFITCWKYTFLQYTNFVASSNCNYFQLQSTNSNWVGPLSLAQLCPSLFLIFMLNWSNLQSSYRTL